MVLTAVFHVWYLMKHFQAFTSELYPCWLFFLSDHLWLPQLMFSLVVLWENYLNGINIPTFFPQIVFITLHFLYSNITFFLKIFKFWSSHASKKAFNFFFNLFFYKTGSFTQKLARQKITSKQNKNNVVVKLVTK